MQSHNFIFATTIALLFWFAITAEASAKNDAGASEKSPKTSGKSKATPEKCEREADMIEKARKCYAAICQSKKLAKERKTLSSYAGGNKLKEQCKKLQDATHNLERRWMYDCCFGTRGLPKHNNKHKGKHGHKGKHVTRCLVGRTKSN